MVALAQKKLREQVEELLTQMARRLGADESFKNISTLLSQAIPEMKNAEAKLQAAAPDAAATTASRNVASRARSGDLATITAIIT